MWKDSSWKVSSWKDKEGNHIEMGLHVFFGCYYNLFGIMERTGSYDLLRMKEHIHTFVNKGGELGALDFRFPVGAPVSGLQAFARTEQLGWGDKAAKEAGKYGTVSRAADTKSSKYTCIPSQSEWKLDPEASYVHYTANETVNGVEFKYTPDVGSVPLVTDMSSNFLSKPVDVEKHVLMYAGAQKNAGPAGVTCTIVREDVLGKELPICPTQMSYKEFAAADSMYNTPPCYAMYVMSLYMEYTKAKGGISYWDDLSEKKSQAVYGTIDASDGFYTCPIDSKVRSRMNVPFQIKGGDEALEKKFLEQAKKMKLYNLAGHRSVGGCRASLYNGVPLEGVDALISFMKSFADENAA